MALDESQYKLDLVRQIMSDVGDLRAHNIHHTQSVMDELKFHHVAMREMNK